MEWFSSPVLLEGKKVKLIPLEKEHYEGLITAAQNPDIWTFFNFNGMNTEVLTGFLDEALQMRETGAHYPFVVMDKANNKIIGTTRFGNINKPHRGLEIGWTWYNPEYWSKGYNEECKLLLLTYCFEELKAIRVEIKAWEKNLRSRKAIERIGAKYEGVLRNHMIRQDGVIRSTAYYSILPEEWDEVRHILQQLI